MTIKRIRTDIDRLHRVCLGEQKGRRSGYTFASCYDVLGEIYKKTDKIYFITKYNKDIKYIIQTLVRILLENNIEFAILTPTIVKTNHSEIRFMDNHTYKSDKLYGIYDYTVIYEMGIECENHQSIYNFNEI